MTGRQRNRFSNLIRCGGILCTKYISIIKSGHVDVIFDRIIIFIIDLLIDRGVYKFCHRLSVIIQHDISFFIGLFPQETGRIAVFPANDTRKVRQRLARAKATAFVVAHSTLTPPPSEPLVQEPEAK